MHKCTYFSQGIIHKVTCIFDICLYDPVFFSTYWMVVLCKYHGAWIRSSGQTSKYCGSFFVRVIISPYQSLLFTAEWNCWSAWETNTGKRAPPLQGILRLKIESGGCLFIQILFSEMKNKQGHKQLFWVPVGPHNDIVHVLSSPPPA